MKAKAKKRDVLVVWDADDTTTDIYLHPAYGLARTPCSPVSGRGHLRRARPGDRGHRRARWQPLEIEKSAHAVRKQGDKILAGSQAMRDALERQLDELRTHVDAVRERA